MDNKVKAPKISGKAGNISELSQQGVTGLTESNIIPTMWINNEIPRVG